MLHVSSLTELPAPEPTYMAVGVFDGVHAGHAQLLGRMVAAARADGVRSAVLTFFPHPQAVIQKLSGRLYLSTLQKRAELLGGLGVDVVITQSFDEGIRQTRAADFVAMLQKQVGMVGLWSGDFGLGYRREGTAAYLRDLGGFAVHELHDVLLVGGERVSSTRIRQLLAEGDVAAVAPLLARPYAVSGVVVEGDKRGRTINFPTANLDVWAEQVLPANGVYATVAHVGGHIRLAATNIGVRPTVDGHHHRVEAHLLDFEGDLYGQTLHLEFLQRVRPEQKFSGLAELQAQIAADVAQVRGIDRDKR
jgi:riboflavin kinase/FMN adenylyltransferase